MEVEDPMSPIMAITPVTPTDNNEPLASEEQPNKRRRKKSIVWEHFTIETVGAGCMRACCKQCKKSFAYITGSKLAGTSHLKRHIALGICPVSRQKNESSPYTPGSKTDPPKKRFRASPGFPGIPLDQDRCNYEIAKMIILHDYPLHIVEHPAFIDFVRTLQPHYNMASFNTIQGECVAVYLREKQSLLNLINGIPGRVNLTLDLGTSNLDIGYAFLTGHFIDGDWNLQRRILNVVILPFYDSDYAFNQAVVSCLSDWHLGSKLFTLTLDQSISNETVIGNLRGLLSVKNPFVLHGQLLKGNCYARVLSRLAQEALIATGEIVRRIRESVKYVKTSEAHDEKFTELRQQLQVPSTKELIIDDQTKWNTTYQMLLAACELKEVFACLDTSDPVYKINPSIDDWKKADILCTYLKLLYDAANILTGPYPPTHVFYHEVYKIQLELTHAAMSQDPFVSNLTKPLKEKFDQYWKDCFLVLAIAVVMDPRFKMKLLEFSFPKVFGEDAGMWIKSVDDGIHELFVDYLAPHLHLPATYVEEGHASIPQSDTQEVEVAPAPDGHSQGVPAQGMHPQELPLQALHPDKATPQEVPFQDGHHQEVFLQESLLQEVPSQEVTPQEMHTEEVPSQEASSHEIHTEVPSEEPPSQEMLAQEVTPQISHTEEVPSQEVQSEEVPSQELPLQEMHNEEVHLQDVHPEEVPSQEIPDQETCTKEVPPQEVSVQEMQTDVQPKEMHTEDAPQQAMHTDDAPPQAMHTEEALPQAMHTEAPPEEIQTEAAAPQEMHTEGAAPQEMLTEEGASLKEVAPQGMHAEEAAPQGMHPEEAAPQGMHAEEAAPQEMHPEEAPPQEMQPEEAPPQEMHTEEVTSQEMQLQVIHQEMQPQELHTQDLPMLSIGDGLSDFDIYISEISSGQHVKSELDQYLEESLLPRVHEFDVLGWWKLNRLKYPTLSKMAADILSIPVSTVGPDSVFDTESKTIDSYRSSLRGVTLEALVCAKDWLQRGSSLLSSSSQEVSNALVKKEF